MNNLNNIGTNSKDPDFTENCHILVSFKIKCGEKVLENEIIFIRLADSCRVSSQSQNKLLLFFYSLSFLGFILNDFNCLGNSILNRTNKR
jgi:hypothetical protein